ncbi:CHAT domain-containing protein [Coleofasciculus sp. E2-BRE-01]|uniref:CHAT domain-containing protein n=1 Tax=Coleofasciculus sp. E2-BRE-01 TaxID=3069524 RepID=UPI003302C78D
MAKEFGTNKNKKHKKRKIEPPSFLTEVLGAIGQSPDDLEIVYSLLQANSHKLNDDFLQQFCKWADTTLRKDESKTARFISLKIIYFNTLLMQFPLGNRAINLEIAIKGYEIVSEMFSQAIKFEEKLLWSELLNNLSLAYTNRIRGNRVENLEKAILVGKQALTIDTRKKIPQLWAGIHNNLGGAYSNRVLGQKADNLEEAIRHFQAALDVCSREKIPSEWAKLQHNFGDTYLHRIRGNRAENLEVAIEYIEAALEIYTKEMFPKEWANAQNTLAVTYQERIRGDRSENLEKAIAYCQAALQIHTREAFPQKWVQTQMNLANVYRDRIRGNLAENLEIAIAAYKSALQVATKEEFPREWATIQNNLGMVYSKRTYDAEHQERAIAAYEATLQVYSQETFPKEWAMAQKNLGLVYSERIRGNRTENLEKAMTAYQAASQVFSRDAFPDYWAKNQNNLAIAYTNLGKIEEAIACCRLALEVFTPITFPAECFIAARQFGEIAAKAKRWAESIEGYGIAIEAVETSRSWATSESRRQEISAEAFHIYHNMVQVCINAGQLEKALETVERSRAKRLVDLMASNDLYQSDEIAPDVKELLQKFDNLQQRIDQERIQNKSSNNRELMGIESHPRNRAAFQAENDAIASLEADKLHVWEQLRRLDPVLAGEIKVDAPNFAQIQQLVDEPTTAILSFYTTTNDLHLFILRQNKLTLHTCPGQGINTLQRFISQNWLQPYIEDKLNWKSHINTFLNELSQHLQLTELITNHLNGINELIIIPHLLLHQIPLAALPIPNSSPASKNGASRDYFGDKFLLRYTPSCQILKFCHQRRDQDVETLSATQYGTVEDATDDLPFASFEGEQIARLHNIPDNLRLKGKTQATVKNYRHLVHQVQVIHSSHHAEFRLDNPLESVLKLADGHITLGQLMTPGWRLPDLFDVFLSCCETGLGLPEITDDSLTLSTGFLCAGARSVVSSLWSVADLATALFSIFYYQQRQQGKNRPEALRQAQIKLRELQKDELLNREDIKEFCQQAEAKRKEARRKRNQCQPDSTDYLKWESDYRKYHTIIQPIQTIKKSPDEYPFSQPRFWAAFTCQGLR